MLQADAKMLTASGDQCVHMWDTASAQGLGQFRGHNGSVKSVCPNPDGQPTFTSGPARDSCSSCQTFQNWRSTDLAPQTSLG